jgi:uncharacterized protein YdhG (YjbR/CyaY superfamily)
MKKASDTPLPKNIDEYLALLPENTRNALESLRKTIKQAAPEAEEVISYNMPAFKYQGMLVYFAAFKNHCSLFVGNGSLVLSLKNELKDYSTAKSGIHFTPEKPLPEALIKKIVWTRMGQNEEMMAAKQTNSKKTKK